MGPEILNNGGSADSMNAVAASPSASQSPTRSGDDSTLPDSGVQAACERAKAAFLARFAKATSRPERMPKHFRAASRFKRLAELGRGGLGRVHKAIDLEFNRVVAVKESLRVSQASSESDDPFFREYRLTARLQHPGVPAVYSAGRLASGRRFYSMRLVEGESLFVRIQRSRKQSGGTCVEEADLNDLVDRLVFACEVVSSAHSAGVLHLDLKPENILVEPSGATFVVDWGLAVDVDKEGPPEGTSVRTRRAGTPGYMAPEQNDAEPVVDVRTDVFGLGAILHTILVGRPVGGAPNARPNWRVTRIVGDWLHSGPPSLRSSTSHRHESALAATGAPPELVSVCLRAIQPDPARRYQRVADLREDLLAWRRRGIVGAHRHQYSWRERLRRFLLKHRTIARVVVGAVIVLTVGLGIAGWQVMDSSARAISALNRERQANGLMFDAIEEMSDTITANEVLASPLLKDVRGRLLEKLARQYSLWTERGRGEGDEQARVAKGLASLARIEVETERLDRAGDAARLAETHWRHLLDEDFNGPNWRGLSDCLALKIAILLASGQIDAARISWDQWQALLARRPEGLPESQYRSAEADSASSRVQIEYSAANATSSETLRHDLLLVARDWADRSVAMRKAIADSNPYSTQRHDLSRALNSLALMTQKSGSRVYRKETYLRALAIYDEALGILSDLELSPSERSKDNIRATRAAFMFNAIMAYNAASDFEGACRTGRTAISLLESLARDYPLVIQYRRDLARGWGNLSDSTLLLFESKRDPRLASEALDAESRAITEYLALHAQFADRGFHTGAVTYLVRRGRLLHRLGNDVGAVASYAQAFELLEAPEQIEPANLGQLLLVATGDALLASSPTSSAKSREWHRQRLARLAGHLVEHSARFIELKTILAQTEAFEPHRDLPEVELLLNIP